LYIVGLFCAKSFVSYGLMVALLIFSVKVSGVKPKALISVDRENIALSCFKRSEREENVYIFRLFECQGTAASAHVELPVFGRTLDAEFKPFEIKTYKIKDGTVIGTDMLEGAVPLE